jgi:transketolase
MVEGDVRQAYGDALVELGRVREDVVVCDANTSVSTQTQKFAKAFPKRFFQIGIAEADMMGIAAGLALSGKTVFASTFAVFGAGEAYNQVRQSICYNNANVKLVCTHGGVTVGEDGGTHMMLEDFAMMRAMPRMKVLSTADAEEIKKIVPAIADEHGQYYVRLVRPKQEILPEHEFSLHKASLLREGNDVTLAATGVMVNATLKAADLLKQAGVSARVLSIHSIKPLDENAILNAARDTGGIVTVEDHGVIGGLGGAVAEVLSEKRPTLLRRVGVRDVFGRSGKMGDCLKYFGLTPEEIARNALEITSAKATVTK